MPVAQLAGWIILGLLAGAIARWILPGEERGGWFGAIILGILGAIVGGWIAHRTGFLSAPEPGVWIPTPKSVLSASVGSIVLLAIWKWLKA